MKNLWIIVPILALFGGRELHARAQELHPARVLSIAQVSSTDTDRTFEVTFRHRCKDIVQGAFVTLMPQPSITEHAHHVVGIMLFDTGRICAAADQIEKRIVHVPFGDVVDRTPLALQPGD